VASDTFKFFDYIVAMSGHSKWAQIKRQKGTADVKRSGVFTKMSNAISVAVRDGGKNPEMNFKLRLAIERARAVNMPNQSIERAIARGAGEGSDAIIDVVFYEGFGPGGAALVVETMTDNKNRTSNDIRAVFGKHGGTLGTPNSVKWQFSSAGLILIAKKDLPTTPRDELELQLIDAGADDVRENPEGIEITTPPNQLKAVQDKILSLHIPVATAELILIPQNPVQLEPAAREKLDQLISDLENLQDVHAVYTNNQP